MSISTAKLRSMSRQSSFKDVKSLKSKASSRSGGKKKKAHSTKKRRALHLLRALVRKVLDNIFWLADTTDVELGTNEELNFYILTHRKKKRVLSLEDKICLKGPTNSRSPKQIESILKKICALKSFRNYPDNIIKEFLLHAKFECWRKDRVLVRQGYVPNFVYYIITGSVDIVLNYPDPIFENETIRQVDKLIEGDNFGELPILYNETHPGTATVSSDWVEMLVLPRDVFILILEETVKKQWDGVRWALKKFPHFDKFPESAIRKLCSVASLMNLPPETIIPKKNEYATDLSTLLIDGTCKVVQTIYVIEDRSRPVQLRYEMYGGRIPEDHKTLPKNVKPIVMEVCTLRRRCIFGLGEKMSEHTIITETECLLVIIPRYFLTRYNISNIWETIVGTLDLLYPETQEIFNAFVENKKWLVYKRKLSNEIYSRLHPPCMSTHDSPVVARARMLRIRGKLYDKVVKMPYYSFGEKDVQDTIKTINDKTKIIVQNQISRSEDDQLRCNNIIDNLKKEFQDVKNDKLNPLYDLSTYSLKEISNLSIADKSKIGHKNRQKSKDILKEEF